MRRINYGAMRRSRGGFVVGKHVSAGVEGNVEAEQVVVGAAAVIAGS
jgi:hypothetical protein